MMRGRLEMHTDLDVLSMGFRITRFVSWFTYKAYPLYLHIAHNYYDQQGT